MKRLNCALIGSLLFFASCVFANEPTLTISTKTDKKIFKLSELQQRKDVEVIVVNTDPAYPGRQMKYQAIKVTNLFDEIKVDDDAVVQFIALDGFSAPLSKQRLLNKLEKESIAYVAIESLKEKWPALKAGRASAGPFYLIWKNPELSHIGPEEWPFMLAAFEVKDTLKATYPKIFPSDKLSDNSSVTKGFKVFVKNCFACHTLNKSGAANLGPDLNYPLNPTEYFKPTALKKLIRNPQTLRHWPNSRMNGFDASVLSDEDLDHIIAYLEHMANRKTN